MSFLTGLEHFVRQDEPLSAHTWFRLGGPAEYFAEPNTLDELKTLVTRCYENELSVRLIGGGSNLLVREKGVSGVVIQLSAPAFSEISIQGTRIKCSGGARLSHLISAAVGQGLEGLEPLVGIPGTVGGALHCNAGSRGEDVGQQAVSSTVMTRTGEVIERSGDELVFSYRESSLSELVILSAEFELVQKDPEELAKRMQKQWIVKKASQPLSDQNTGCIFRNPQGTSAAALIESAGLKGAKVGGAEISDRHSNFIVASQDATSDDVLRLIDLVATNVEEQLGVQLVREIDVW
jgi:UDP-N-acetylmuramate dehydrogenase